MNSDRIQDAALKCYSQFVSSPPHRASFLSGFEVGALWMEHEQEAELAALRERVKLLESLARDAIKWGDGWCPTHRCCATSYEAIQEAFEAALKDQPTASPAEPDPTPLRTCLESLAAISAKVWRLNRAGDNEALRAMAGRLKQVREVVS